jgi:hypothetical protein
VYGAFYDSAVEKMKAVDGEMWIIVDCDLG